MKKWLLASALSLLSFSTAFAAEAPSKDSAEFMLYAETDNGAAEVVIYSNFYTSTIDEDAVLDEWSDASEHLTRGAMAELIYRILN